MCRCQGDAQVADYFWDCGRDRICPPPFDTPEEGELALTSLLAKAAPR